MFLFSPEKNLFLLRQKNTAPINQYCLTLMPLINFTSFELKPNKFSAPWLPGISMTVRFRPVGNEEINLLRMQVAEVRSSDQTK